jgi:aminopeptidase N
MCNPGQVEDGRVSFGKLSQMVAFYSEKIGYDYPYSKYAQTMVQRLWGRNGKYQRNHYD